MTPGSRKMRRPRDTSREEILLDRPYCEIYDSLGDSGAALTVLTALEESSPTIALNQYLLENMNGMNSKNYSEILSKLEAAEKELTGDNIPSRSKRKRNRLVLEYNKALILHSSGGAEECMRICTKHLKELMEKNEAPSDDLRTPLSRMAFLLLESVFSVAAQSSDLPIICRRLNVPAVEKIIAWLEQIDTEKDPHLKFLLLLYKARFYLSNTDASGTRLAKKELKSAMEVLQHKLRASGGGDTVSVVSSVNSEENGSHGSEPYVPQLPRSTVLQKYNQAALTLKAHLEQLKGNIKKSLVLCGESRGAAIPDENYQSLHHNNLGLVYGAHGRMQLSLHSLAKGISQQELLTDSSPLFYADGTAQPSNHITLPLLWNAGIVALRARNYMSSYECLSACLSRSDVYYSNPQGLFFMAEACVGIYSIKESQKETSGIQVDGKFRGILLGGHNDGVFEQEVLAETLGSREDLEQVRRNPLLRARACLEQALQNELDLELLVSVRLTLAYVHLVVGNPDKALESAQTVMTALSNNVDQRFRSHLATARLYCAEALCLLDRSTQAMEYVNGSEDSVHELALELGGVTLGVAASDGAAKRRLARAQAMVRLSASAVACCAGNLTAAKQLATSAQGMEEAYMTDRVNSPARRALAYCLLRGGNPDAALSLLQ